MWIRQRLTIQLRVFVQHKAILITFTIAELYLWKVSQNTLAAAAAGAAPAADKSKNSNRVSSSKHSWYPSQMLAQGLNGKHWKKRRNTLLKHQKKTTGVLSGSTPPAPGLRAGAQPQPQGGLSPPPDGQPSAR